ncbi:MULTISPECIES: hypothetical protein [Deinococcus]|uniref:Uncharacterized protein n=1 Tax=Deinococcus multiflagellatus TaxID=1656887 RepID=A0ABW1ZP35_9DEIO|nr:MULTISPECIES: hypothetical protein [Deinococcus]MBZ9713422.1 hypothetical protein [Deinococcus multiflagellatus]
MSTFLILALLMLVPVWLLRRWTKVRPELEQKGRSVDPLTGALYAGGQRQAREGLNDRLG